MYILAELINLHFVNIERMPARKLINYSFSRILIESQETAVTYITEKSFTLSTGSSSNLLDPKPFIQARIQNSRQNVRDYAYGDGGPRPGVWP